jgi:hypothetical protein
MIQVNTQNRSRQHTLTFLKTLSGSVQNALTLAVLFFALVLGQQAQAQSPGGTFHISVGDKLPDFQLAQLAGLDEANLTFSVPGGASVSGAATMLTEYAFSAAGAPTPSPSPACSIRDMANPAILATITPCQSRSP